MAKYMVNEIGFPELLEQTIGSIHFMPGVYQYGMSLLLFIHCRVAKVNFGPFVAK